MEPDGRSWEYVGKAVQARLDELGLSRTQAGLSRTKMDQLILEGRPIARPASRAKVSTALGWTPDSLDRILAGGEPVEVSPGSDPGKLAEVEERLAEVEEQLEALKVLLRAPRASQPRGR